MSDPTTNALNSVLRRIRMLSGIGDVTFAADSDVVQLLQVKISDQETIDETPRVAEYGFTSMPKVGCHAVLICVGGDQSGGVVIGTNDPTARMKNLQPGEVAIFDDQGQSVYLTRAGIVVNGGGLPITVNGNVTINGTLHATGPITGDSTITAPNVVGTTDVQFGSHHGNTHVHSNGNGGANTGGPI
ncbi:phage baseplate assembly protein [Rhodoferax sp. GW822-FHT02A01]|uniref:phage baseplate assembly protein domain-containing protein n=1 Tax=Rhodoferax sp. GW822-FHT02A01 TaxID=3141537 RepID=UPI00315D33EA